ncbi:MAG TPA: PIG-L deacetylase family protein [Vicinamibacterales bacterium]|nr:PIG-L deacetylase family protein [Vicinamibacterales bacterium]
MLDRFLAPTADPATVLLLFSHPDDITFAMGGTTRQLADRGHRLHAVVATSGDKGTYGGLTMETLAKRREQEERDANAVLGVAETTFLGLRDCELQLEPPHALRVRLVKTIRRVRPDLLITHDPASQTQFSMGYHPDHRTLAYAALDSVVFARLPNFFPGDLPEPAHRTPHVWTVSFTGAVPVDITVEWEAKVQAIRMHRTQMEKTPGREAQYIAAFRDRARDPGTGRLYERFNCAERF